MDAGSAGDCRYTDQWEPYLHDDINPEWAGGVVTLAMPGSRTGSARGQVSESTTW